MRSRSGRDGQPLLSHEREEIVDQGGEHQARAAMAGDKLFGRQKEPLARRALNGGPQGERLRQGLRIPDIDGLDEAQKLFPAPGADMADEA